MKSNYLFMALTLLLGITFAALARADEGNVIVPTDQVKFVEVMPGVQKSDLWGDCDKGAHGTLTKFKAGLMNPLHSHTSDIRLIVVSGTMVFQSEGGPEVRLGPGSYLLQKSGLKHISGCAEGADCLFFEEQSDKFDFIPVEAPKPKTDATPAPAKKSATEAPKKK